MLGPSPDHALRVWETGRGLLAAVVEEHTDWVTALAWTSAAQLVSGSRDSAICLWRWAPATYTLTLLREFDTDPYDWVATDGGIRLLTARQCLVCCTSERLSRENTHHSFGS